ncbi:unnamed protein product [Brachionus calyciflorus]|uniref:EF-hand domain-containing protein n=1 Tax=Brachionus calyciflorus TaxID=104777 RepID=A0A813XFR9_9BILA|nr:unnamed protein product [Brachionus calyciflorus]
MKIKTLKLFEYLNLVSSDNLLTIKDLKLVIFMFKTIDVHRKNALNDLQFYSFMKCTTNLSSKQIITVFKKLDINKSGFIEIEEFYLIVCILISTKDHKEKDFVSKHAKTVFDLLDEDCSGTISAKELNKIGYLFNFGSRVIKKIFDEFDITGDEVLFELHFN